MHREEKKNYVLKCLAQFGENQKRLKYLNADIRFYEKHLQMELLKWQYNTLASPNLSDVPANNHGENAVERVLLELEEHGGESKRARQIRQGLDRLKAEKQSTLTSIATVHFLLDTLTQLEKTVVVAKYLDRRSDEVIQTILERDYGINGEPQHLEHYAQSIIDNALDSLDI